MSDSVNAIAVHALPVRVYFWRSEQIPGTWVAHVLDFDCVTQAESLGRAVELAIDAAMIVANMDVEAGCDPYDRRAEEADWERLNALASKPGAARKSLPQIIRDEARYSEAGAVLWIPLGQPDQTSQGLGKAQHEQAEAA
ncbi:hypothetical protein ACNOYE_16410 [Nannocystaceae bacterium ST9]